MPCCAGILEQIWEPSRNRVVVPARQATWLAGRYTTSRFITPIDCSKIPALDFKRSIWDYTKIKYFNSTIYRLTATRKCIFSIIVPSCTSSFNYYSWKYDFVWCMGMFPHMLGKDHKSFMGGGGGGWVGKRCVWKFADFTSYVCVFYQLIKKFKSTPVAMIQASTFKSRKKGINLWIVGILDTLHFVPFILNRFIPYFLPLKICSYI